MAAPPPPPPANMWTVIAETKRIINAHSRHFLALSVLFLLPLSFAATVFPTLYKVLASSSSSSSSDPNHPQALLKYSFLFHRQPHHDHNHHHHHQQSFDVKSILLIIGYMSFSTLFFLFASCSVTYSVVQGFYGRPVKLLSAIASIATSFFPMLATLICAQAIISLVAIVFAVAMFLAVKGIEFIGGDICYSSPFFVGSVASILVILVLVLIYLQVEWALRNAIVVAESGCGYYPLRRSAYLVKGMRGVTLSLMLFLSVLPAVLMVSISQLTLESFSDGAGWGKWAFVIQNVVASSISTALMLLSLAANVVLYMYCKAMHGELAMEIAKEFASEYFSLPFDDGKTPHVVSVASDTV